MKKKPLKKMPHGEGSMSYVTRRNTEYICYRKMIGDERHKKRHVVYGQTQQECLKLMRQAEAEYNKQIILLNPIEDGGKNIFKNSIQAWLDNVKSKTVKDSSFDIIENVCQNHIEKSEIGNMQFSRITSDDINNFLKNKKDDGYSLSMVDRMYSILNQYFKYVYAKDRPHNPMIDVAPITKKDYNLQIIKDAESDEEDDIFFDTRSGININTSKIVLTDEEMKLFIDVAGMEYKRGLQGWKHGWGLVFLMFSFMRIGEAVALKWKDIDFDNRTVNIYKTISQVKDRSESDKKTKWIVTITKTESGTRTNLLSNDAMNAIQNHFDRIANGRSYEEMKNNYVFETYSGGFSAPPNLYNCVKSIIKKAGIDDSKAGLHKLRHTGISYYIRHGVPIDIIAKMAGHSSSLITRRVYYTLVNQQFKDAVDIMNNINK